MNWKEIKDRCPKAINVFETFYVDKFHWNNFDYDIDLCAYMNHELLEYYYEDRFLYDFFDENEIAICINPDYYSSMEYHPSKYKDGDYIYYWINVGFKWEDDIEYKTRTEAEQAAFTKAFEILESKLNG